ncbi:MFS general substrate transporter [Zopfia rhizophila CBS 207.26]|uniref:MFS general substrate transporter n=1 Tax=Zopfia rhizophila CBS 207.26 TaxID=1314779 RepID=A0A6A6DAM5_9PEZI|nr:MFS general substrate transporter [Zopfia rhizophila CBS 207.26]
MTDIDVIKMTVQHTETVGTDEPGDTTVVVSEKQQAHIRGKIDRHMLLLVCVLYVLSYIDRGNIGNAKTAGAQDDLGLSDSQWAWVLNSFYICYTLFEWTTLLWKLLPAHIYISVLCVLWGVVATCTGTVTKMAGLCACRAALGILEAAFGAGAPYYLSLFYQRRELGLRVSILVRMSPLANCFAASLAYWISQIKASVEPWRLILLIEGAPTIIVAPFVYFFLADSPRAARFLNQEEKETVVARLATKDTTAKARLNWKQVTVGLGDYQPYVHALIRFCCNYSFAGLANFLPTIVQALGYSSINAQGLTAPPYAAGFCLCIAAAFFSDKFGHQRYIIAYYSAMEGIGYLLLATIKDSTKNSIQYLGIYSFLSSTLYPKTDAPYYVKGCATGCALTFLVTLLSLGLHFKLQYENRKRDREFGPVEDHEQLDVTQLGDMHPKFRYLT